MNVQATLRQAFADAGVRGWLHATPVHAAAGQEVAVDADGPVVMASVYKLPLLVAFADAVDAGTIDPGRQVTLHPSDRTVGETGLSIMSDSVTLSLRDLARSMITVSDNAAADALLDLLGLDAVTATLHRLGLEHTRIAGGTRDIQRMLVTDSGTDDFTEAMGTLFDNDHPTAVGALRPALSSCTTARDMTALLAAIWTDNAASPGQCQFMRRVMAQQVWPHRLSSGFTQPGVMVAGKTGTLGPLRHEVGVISHPQEEPVAVAVFTQAARADQRLPRVDATIGTVARIAVNHLRWPKETRP